jgi:hypothetical protein
MPPIPALYARFVRAQSTEQLLWTTIPTIRMRSHRISRPRGLGPIRRVKLQGQIRHAATGPGMTEHVATIPKDRNHSLSGGTHAWPCSSSARNTDAMTLQYRPRRHRIRPPEASGLLLQQGSPTHQYLVTLYLLEAIKGACKDRSRTGAKKKEETSHKHKAIHEHTTLLDLARAPAGSRTRTPLTPRDLGAPPSLTFACNLYYKHFGAR